MIKDIFKAYDVRAVYPDKLDEQAAWKVGCAAGQFLKQHLDATVKLRDTVVVSRDMRPHSPSLASALMEGLRAAGMNVIDLGMCDTSFIYFAVNHLSAAGGIQTTASHNPIQYNGFKISGAQAKPIGADTGLKDIQKIAETLGPRGSLPLLGTVQQRDLWREYRQHVLQFFQPPKRKLRIFIDSANGMGGKLVPAVFNDLPNVEIIPLNFEITGKFVHEPNPLKAENMVPTQEGVRQHKADLGVSFDGDADRCMLVDDKGQTIGCDHLTALLANHFMSQEKAAGRDGATVVYDLRSSKIVEETLAKLGAKPLRSRVGHVFLKAALRQSGGVFGGELSGHFYFRDNFFADSGAITFAVVMSIMGQSDKPISELVAPYRKYPQSGEQNFHAQDKLAVIAALKSRYSAAKMDELDGITIDSWANKGWWFNVRMSNTEPLLRLNAEARDAATLKALLAEIQPMLGTPEEGH
jgi:phosphomannomutase